MNPVSESRLVSVKPGRGASGDQTRRHNLSTLLQIVHRSRLVSRADLTKISGLNRSTVSGLIGELVERGLVTEREPENSRKVGRPSPVVMPSADLVAVSVNPDADAVTIAVVGFAGNVLVSTRREFANPPTVAETVAAVTSVLEQLGETLAPLTVVGIGVAVPGLVRAEDSVVRYAPHLDWHDVPLCKLLSDSTGLPVWADNDANLAVYAELVFGAGRRYSNIVYINGGRGGLGGGVVVNGALLRGAGGYTGEFGHNAFSAQAHSAGPDGTQGISSDLEELISRQMLLDLLDLPSADESSFENALLSSQNPEVGAEVRRQLTLLSVALRNAVNVLNPEVILLGGYLSALYSREPELLAELVRAQTMAPSVESLLIEKAELGADLLMIGAAELVFGPLLADPTSSPVRGQDG